MEYAAEALSEKYVVSVLRDDTGEKFDVIVLPLPLKKLAISFEKALSYAGEGALVLSGGDNERLSELCGLKGLRFESYFSDETLALKNAALTAEAAVMLMIQSTQDALLGAATLITGYGRIARRLARLLSSFGSRVTIAARSAVQRETARIDGFNTVTLDQFDTKVFDFIVNTAPARLFLDKEFKKGAVFMELASLPESPLDDQGVKYVYAGGLPGKYSPKAAGKAIATTIEEILEC